MNRSTSASGENGRDKNPVCVCLCDKKRIDRHFIFANKIVGYGIESIMYEVFFNFYPDVSYHL